MGMLAKLLPAALKRWLLASLVDAGEDKFSRVFHASPDWIVITRLSDGLVVDANLGFQTISGYSAQEVVGHRMSQFNVWVFPQQRTDMVKELMETGTARDKLVQLRRRDGGVRDCIASSTLIALEGEVHSHAVWIARDVTQARQAEIAQRESESRFARLFEQSPLPMCYASISGGLSTNHWNQAWFDAFGFDARESQGKSGLDLNIWVNPQDRADLLAMTERGETSSDMEVQMRRANGEIRWILVSTRVLTEAQRTLFISSYFDLTQRLQAQREIHELNTHLEARVAQRTTELQQSNQELLQTLETLRVAKDQLVESEKLAALGALVAGIAHELNTPIGNGLTVASTLEHRVQQFEQRMADGMKRSDLQGFVEDMRLASDILSRNLERASALISSFKQVAVDQTSSQRRTFLLNAVISEILVALQPGIGDAACAVSCEVDAQLWLDSYPGPLGQVLTHLLHNAITHGFESRHPGSIQLRACAQAGGLIRITVHDDGRGIRPEDLHHVFEPFFTTRLGQGGSGLGLHIVHNIVTNVLGGQIEVWSLPGQGATFTLTIPATAP